uniref:AraC family transcriptional regulator n=1 Tax=uncultured Draconibacterium sp. TaxID=1573823 RepID=UPI003217C59D
MQHLENILLTTAFIVPLILSITILVDSKKNFSKRVMGLALFNAFFVFLANYFYFRNLRITYIALHGLHIASVLWLFPSVYLYVKSIVRSKIKFKKELLHLIPGLLFGVIASVLFYGLLNQEERIYYLTNYRTDIKFTAFNLKLIYAFRMVDVAVIVVQVIYYSVVMIRIPGKYHKILKEEYSNIENFSLNWLKWFNVLFVFIGLLSILFYVFNPLEKNNELFLVTFLFTISVFMWIIGIWSFKQQNAKNIVQISAPAILNNKCSTLENEKLMANALLEYFKNEQPYLNPELNLTGVCKQIGTNRTYLSGLINSSFGMNFNTFVNQYRVKYVKDYLKNNPGTSNIILADVGGFGSVSSLKRAMQKFNNS